MKSWESVWQIFTQKPQVWQVWRQLMERYLNTETAFDPLNACHFDGIWLDQAEKCVTYIQNTYTSIYILYTYMYKYCNTLFFLHICKHHRHYLHYIIIYLHSMHIFCNTFIYVFLEHRGIHPSLGPKVSTCPCPCVSSVSPRAFWTGVSRYGRFFFFFRTKPGYLDKGERGFGFVFLKCWFTQIVVFPFQKLGFWSFGSDFT